MAGPPRQHRSSSSQYQAAAQPGPYPPQRLLRRRPYRLCHPGRACEARSARFGSPSARAGRRSRLHEPQGEDPQLEHELAECACRKPAQGRNRRRPHRPARRRRGRNPGPRAARRRSLGQPAHHLGPPAAADHLRGRGRGAAPDAARRHRCHRYRPQRSANRRASRLRPAGRSGAGRLAARREP